MKHEIGFYTNERTGNVFKFPTRRLFTPSQSFSISQFVSAFSREVFAASTFTDYGPKTYSEISIAAHKYLRFLVNQNAVFESGFFDRSPYSYNQFCELPIFSLSIFE